MVDGSISSSQAGDQEWPSLLHPFAGLSGPSLGPLVMHYIDEQPLL